MQAQKIKGRHYRELTRYEDIALSNEPARSARVLHRGVYRLKERKGTERYRQERGLLLW